MVRWNIHEIIMFVCVKLNYYGCFILLKTRVQINFLTPNKYDLYTL